MGKYVMERLFKVFNIAGMAFIFVGGHTGYISGKDMLYQLLLFVIVYCFMARTYEAFETQTKKSMELIYSQGLALFLADAVTYLTGTDCICSYIYTGKQPDYVPSVWKERGSCSLWKQ